MMFCDNRNTLMYKIIGEVIYTIIDEYICLDYPGLLQRNLSKHDNNFNKTKFNNLYGLGIPKILMNIMPCHEFVKSSVSTVILICCNDLAPYYLSKLFDVVES